MDKFNRKNLDVLVKIVKLLGLICDTTRGTGYQGPFTEMEEMLSSLPSDLIDMKNQEVLESPNFNTRVETFTRAEIETALFSLMPEIKPDDTEFGDSYTKRGLLNDLMGQLDKLTSEGGCND